MKAEVRFKKEEISSAGPAWHFDAVVLEAFHPVTLRRLIASTSVCDKVLIFPEQQRGERGYA